METTTPDIILPYFTILWLTAPDSPIIPPNKVYMAPSVDFRPTIEERQKDILKSIKMNSKREWKEKKREFRIRK